MLNWTVNFINSYFPGFSDIGFTLAFAALIVDTFFELAFHGFLRVQIGAKGVVDYHTKSR